MLRAGDVIGNEFVCSESPGFFWLVGLFGKFAACWPMFHDYGWLFWSLGYLFVI